MVSCLLCWVVVSLVELYLLKHNNQQSHKQFNRCGQLFYLCKPNEVTSPSLLLLSGHGHNIILLNFIIDESLPLAFINRALILHS